MSNYVNLHVHSAYSLLDSIVRIEALVDRVTELGQVACAITDHGTLAGAVKFTDACLKKGIKPILGMEAYIAPDSRHRKKYAKGEHSYSHLILLAKNAEGWENLKRLSTLSYSEGFYKKPRIDHALLKQYRKGLIVTSACIGGDIAIHLRGGFAEGEEEAKVEYNAEIAKAKAMWYLSLFEDDFYFEMQSYGKEYQEQLNAFYRAFVPASQRTCSADCHYVMPDEHDTHDTLICSANPKAKKWNDNERWRFPADQFFVKSEEEMLRNFLPQEVANTRRIADKIDFELPLRKQFFMPELPSDITANGGGDEVESFKKYCREGLVDRVIRPDGVAGVELYSSGFTKQRIYDDPTFVPEYRDRLEYEMDVFIRARFTGYALLLFDLMRFCRDNAIFTGDGRGSGAGSLVLYALGITHVDPVQRDLPFERFINAGRLERFAPPDVDLDFPQSRREEVVSYLRERYGSERVAQIGTYATLGPPATIKKIAPALGIDHGTINRLCSLIPATASVQGSGAASSITDSTVTLDKIYAEVPAFQQIIDSLGNTGLWLLHYARGIQRLGTHASKHASGVLITDRPVVDVVPLMTAVGDSQRENLLSQFDMFDAEAMGLVKFDILGLKTLDVLAYVEEQIKANDDPGFSFHDIDLDDPLAYTLMRQGKTVGIFQAEGAGFGGLLPQIRPSTVEHLAALTSLCRPGPMLAGITSKYIKRIRGEEIVTYDIPALEPILKKNFGCIVFQEDIMSIAHRLAGYSLSEADDLRKIMGKKQIDKMPKQKEKFLQGLEANTGTPRALGEKLWNEIAAMAEYVFNRSHAMAYSYITAKTAWAKAHYPAYFIAAAMTSEIRGDGKELPALLQDAKYLHVALRYPDINRSQEGYEAEGANAIRVGLLGITGVGPKAVETILVERATNGPFKSRDDFRSRIAPKACNAAVLAALENAGAFDALEGRTRLVTTERLMEELSLFGFFLSGHPVERLRQAWAAECDDLVTIAQVLGDTDRESYYVRGQFGRRREFGYTERRLRCVVTKVEKKKAKQAGAFNLVIDLEDETGSAKCFLSQKNLNAFGNPEIKKSTFVEIIGRRAEAKWEGYIDASKLQVIRL